MEDLTISELVSDPMIGLLLKADGITLAAFALLLENAARINGDVLRARRDGDEMFSKARSLQWFEASERMTSVAQDCSPQ